MRFLIFEETERIKSKIVVSGIMLGSCFACFIRSVDFFQVLKSALQNYAL